ncbi:DUF1392 family protein, partial [Nostoc cf. edaphicum LEGE 07299]
KHECWIYSIDCRNEILHATQNQIIGTGELESITVQKPAFVLGLFGQLQDWQMYKILRFVVRY